MVSGDFLIWWNAITVRKGREKVFHIFLNVFLVSVFTKGFGYLLCWPRGRGIGLVCKRRFSFHEFYNFLLFNFLIFISFWKIARCGSQVQPTKMTLVRQRVLSSSEVRASDLEHGGSWVRIPSGAQIFSVSSYGWFFTSPFYFLYNIRFFYPRQLPTPTTHTHDSHPRPTTSIHDPRPTTLATLPNYSWGAVFSSSAKQCLLSVNLKPFLLQTEQQTRERPFSGGQSGREKMRDESFQALAEEPPTLTGPFPNG